MTVSHDLVLKFKNFRGVMVPVRVEKDTPGFIYNRLGAPVGLYISVLYERGLVNPEAVDAKIRSIGAPMGPYEIMDYTGLDVNLHGMEYFSGTLSPEFKVPNWLKKMNEAGTLGKKTGKGIFTWPGGARPTIDISKADPNFDPMDIICALTSLREAAAAPASRQSGYRSCWRAHPAPGLEFLRRKAIARRSC